jgi:hypothetical protein
MDKRTKADADLRQVYRHHRMADHPLAAAGGNVLEHRAVLYAVIGPGTHPCHWCGIPVTWLVREKAIRGALVVDHLDNNPRNNDISNLVPTCQPCNSARSSYRVRDDEVFIVRKNGTRLRAEERTCWVCGKTFLFALSANRKKKNAGRYCSRNCMHQWRSVV